MKARSPAASSPSLVSVPSLNELAERPALAQALPLETAQALLIQCVQIQSVLLGRLMEGTRVPVAAPPSLPEPPSEWLSAEQVQKRFGLSPAWLKEHRRELRRAGIVSQPSRKMFVYSARRLGRYVEARGQAPGASS